MARRTRMSMQKRQRELRKAEKAAQKRAKRHGLVVEEEASDEEVDGDESAAVLEFDEEPPAPPTLEAAPDPAPATPETEMTSAQEVPKETAEAYCKVCKAMTSHAVLESTKKTKKPKRVSCETCQDEHPFRAKAPATRKKATKATPKTPAISYESLMADRDLSVKVKYSMSHEFSESDVIDHSTFGVGLVVRVLRDQKIEVWFPEGRKTLAHAR